MKRSIRSRFFLSLLAVMAAAAPAAAQARFSGYLKNLWQYSHGTLDDRPYFLNTSRARLTFDGRKDALAAHFDFDNQVAAGSFYRTRDFKVFGYAPPKPWLSMEKTVSTGTTNGYGIGAYRAWVGLDGARGTLRAGRQRIAWGTGKIWNPTDVLNPYSPTSLERDERRGVDALYGRVGVGDLGQVELVWAGQDRWVDHQLLARAHGTFGGWDASLMGGKIAGSTAAFMVGGDFAGTVLDGTLHGEWGYFHPRWRTPYWKAGIGYDYNFPSETKLRWLKDAAFVVEYYRAGNGQTDAKRYDFAPVLAGTEVSVARDYAGASFGKDLHPLLRADLYAVANADDGSTFFAPSMTWNALNDLYLTAALQRFGGPRRTEYGRQPNQAVLSAQFYF